MKWHVKRLSQAAAGGLIAVAAAGCGNNVAGPHSWQTVLRHTTMSVAQGGNTVVVYDILNGELLDGAGHPLAGTLVRESCNRKYVGGTLVQDYNCTVVVNTVDRVYVFGGHANGILGELPSLGDPRVGGALFLTATGTPPPSPLPNPFRAQVFVQPGGRALP